MNNLVVEPEKCRVCGCTAANPCTIRNELGVPVGACSWIDFDHTLCSALECWATVPLDDLLAMPLFRRLINE